MRQQGPQQGDCCKSHRQEKTLAAFRLDPSLTGFRIFIIIPFLTTPTHTKKNTSLKLQKPKIEVEVYNNKKCDQEKKEKKIFLKFN